MRVQFKFLKRFGTATILVVALSAISGASSFHNLSSPLINPFSSSGLGSSGSPYILTETLNAGAENQDVYLGVRGFGGGFTNTGTPSGAYFQKVITNNTGVAWTSFEVEVGFMNGSDGWDYGTNAATFQGSHDGDGLSFGQGQSGRVTGGIVVPGGVVGFNGSFSSDFWNSMYIDETTNTRDYIQFFNRPLNVNVNPGDTLTLLFRITDNQGTGPGGRTNGPANLNKDWVLRQRVNATPVPEPASMLALGLGAVAVLRRRKKTTSK